MIGNQAEETHELQEAEIEAIKAIFADDYAETHTKTAWGAVNAAHEFTIRIHPLEDNLKDSVGITLHFKLPLTYPNIAPTILLENPIGLSKGAVSTLNTTLQKAIPPLLGTEMVFELGQIAAAHITDHHQVAHLSTSLIEERETRTEELHKAQVKRNLEEDARIQKQNALEQEQLAAKIQADREKRKKIFQQYKDDSLFQDSADPAEENSHGGGAASGLVNSLSTTLIPASSLPSNHHQQSYILERFDDGLTTPLGSVAYNVVCTPDPENGTFGPQFKGRLADPAPSFNVTVQVVYLRGTYFNSISAKRKLQVLRQDLCKFTKIQHQNLVHFYGVDLTAEGRSKDHQNGQRLAFVIDSPLDTTLEAFLNTCGNIRSDKALRILEQVLSGLDALHKAHLTHRYIQPQNIQLSFKPQTINNSGNANPNNIGNSGPHVKLGGCGWQKRLIDMNMSNKFISITPSYNDKLSTDEWLCPSAKDDPFVYTPSRDIWDTGIVFSQMMYGLDVIAQFSSPQHLISSFIDSSSDQQTLLLLRDLLTPSEKRRPSASSILCQIPKILQNTSSLIIKPSSSTSGSSDSHASLSIPRSLSSKFDQKSLVASSSTAVSSGNQINYNDNKYNNNNNNLNINSNANFNNNNNNNNKGSGNKNHLKGLPSTGVGIGNEALVNESLHEQQKGYFWQPRAPETTSRYKSDFIEVEFLGKGGFGQVVKAQNKLDGNFYAIKKIKLPSDPSSEEKILREVTIWSRMSHPHIVRYQTSWVETDSHTFDAQEALGALTESTAAKDKGPNKFPMISSSTQESGESNQQDDEEDGQGQSSSGEGEDDGTQTEQDDEDHATNTTLSEPFSFDMGLDDLDFLSSGGQSKSKSYPAIHFGTDSSISHAFTSYNNNDTGNDQEQNLGSSIDDDDNNTKETDDNNDANKQYPATIQEHSNTQRNRPPRTLYIQMEFIQGITLREAIEEGISEADSWRYLRDILSAMSHFTSINIIHRDLKPTNVFLDSQNRVRIGDFGLAVEQGDVEAAATNNNNNNNNSSSNNNLALSSSKLPDLTSDVGTSLYLAPEVLSKNTMNEHGVRYTDKIDMYSLGIVFFEMWHPMKTGMERIEAIRNLRKPEIILPKTWNEAAMPQQTTILRRLLCHDPAKRASPADILESTLLPPLEMDDAIQECVREIGRRNSMYRPTLISALMKPSEDQSHQKFTYNFMTSSNELDTYQAPACEKIRKIFERRGAVRLESPLLLPVSDIYENNSRPPCKLIDHEGTVVQLPFDLTVPFVHQVAQDPSLHRLKRYNINYVYRDTPGGHPQPILAATYDIVSQQKVLAAEAEAIQVVDEVVNDFPLPNEYIHLINHSGIVDLILTQVPSKHRNSFLDAMQQCSKTLNPWRRYASELVRKTGVSQSIVSAIGAFNFEDDIDNVLPKLEELLPNFVPAVRSYWQDCKTVVSCTRTFGTQRKIIFSPMFVTQPHMYNSGIYFQTCCSKKRDVTLAVGGRVDRLVGHYTLPNSRHAPPHFVSCTIAMKKLVQVTADENEAISQVTLHAKAENERSYGPDTPRRCDVYVVSFATKLMEARMEVVKELWKGGIRADVMYDGDWNDMSPEEMTATCRKEGILWLVIVKGHQFSRDQSLKVRGVLRGGEDEVMRHDLVGHLHERLQEQARIDQSLFADRGSTTRKVKFGAASSSEARPRPFVPDASNFHIVPHHENQRRAKTRQILWDKAFDSISASVSAATQVPVIAVDLDGEAFKRLTETSSWIYGDDYALRRIAEVVPPQKKSYALNDVKKDVQKVISSNDRLSFIWLYSMGDRKPALLSLK